LGAPMSAKIPGGYVILPRSLFQHPITSMPLYYRWIWLYLIQAANHSRRRAGDRLARGQVLVTLDQLAEACSWARGYARSGPSRKDAWKTCEWLRERNAIATTKTTRGIIVTIVNYDIYQNPANYESDNESFTKATMERQWSDNKGDTIDKNGRTEEGKEEEKQPSCFEFFWTAWPRHKRKVGKSKVEKLWIAKGLYCPINVIQCAALSVLQKCHTEHGFDPSEAPITEPISASQANAEGSGGA